jgi:hypothetical protein
VVGDLLEAPAGEVAVEDLNNDRRLFGVRREPGLVVSRACASRVGMSLAL